MAPIIVIAVRLALPFLLLRWKFFGALACLAADYLDFRFMQRFGWGFLANGHDLYQPFDKILDTYYLTFEFFIVLKWQELIIRRTAIFLYIWRFIGFILFIIFQQGILFLIFPNIFEYFYLAYIFIKKYFKNLNLNTSAVAFRMIVFIGLPKMVHEYILHVINFDIARKTIIFFVHKII